MNISIMLEVGFRKKKKVESFRKSVRDSLTACPWMSDTVPDRTNRKGAISADDV